MKVGKDIQLVREAVERIYRGEIRRVNGYMSEGGSVPGIEELGTFVF